MALFAGARHVSNRQVLSSHDTHGKKSGRRRSLITVVIETLQTTTMILELSNKPICISIYMCGQTKTVFSKAPSRGTSVLLQAPRCRSMGVKTEACGRNRQLRLFLRTTVAGLQKGAVYNKGI